MRYPIIVLVTIQRITTTPIELKDTGDGLTGPQPSVLGSVDKIFNQVNDFDQKQCLQKMICEFMGTAEDVVGNAVNNNLGQQTGQVVQSQFSQFQNNPNQFLQSNQLGQNGPIAQAVTSQFGGNNIVQTGQQFLQNGQQFLTSGQQLAQNIQNNNVNRLVQVQTQNGQTVFVPQNQLYSVQNYQQNQNSIYPQNQNSIYPQNQNVYPQHNQQTQSTGNGLVDGLVDTLAGYIATATGKKRRKRQSTMHGQAIRVMQSLGLNRMGAYPFVRAALIGHANKGSPTNCNQLYRECPSETDQLLSYFNNHNGGLFSNTLPSVSNEVGSLFPGLPSLPQVAASTFGDIIGSSSSNNVASTSSQSGGTGIGLVDGLVDTLAGMFATATG